MRFAPDPALLAQLKRHEGFRAEPYLCAAGKVTIGYGLNLETHPEQIPFPHIQSQVRAKTLAGAPLLRALRALGTRWTPERAEEILDREIRATHAELARLCPEYAGLRAQQAPGSDARADVLLNMAFNIGVQGLLGFKNALAAVAAQDWEAAARHMENSRWRVQVGKRAAELCAQMRTAQRAA